jgi:integrase
MNERSPNQILARTLRRAGLLDEDDRPTVTVHGLRHTAASIMLARRVPLISVSKQLGHANIQITATIYAHLLDDSELDAAAAVFDEPSDPRGTTEPTTERPPLGVVIPLPVRDSARARSSL